MSHAVHGVRREGPICPVVRVAVVAVRAVMGGGGVVVGG